jgi:hypothetical protein
MGGTAQAERTIKSKASKADSLTYGCKWVRDGSLAGGMTRLSRLAVTLPGGERGR